MKSDNERGFVDYVKWANRYLKNLYRVEGFQILTQVKGAREKLLKAFDSEDCEDYSHVHEYVQDSLEFTEKALANQSNLETMKDFGIKAGLSLDRVFNQKLRELGRVEKEKTYETAEEREVARIFRRYGTLTWEEVSDILDVSESTARRRLSSFIDRGEIKKLERKEGEKLELEWVK